MPTDEEYAAFKASELEAAAAIMAGDRYCPDPSAHKREVDTQLLTEAIVKAAAFAHGLRNLAELAAAEYARRTGEPSDE